MSAPARDACPLPCCLRLVLIVSRGPGCDRERCRKAAAECIELARPTTDIERKQVLLTRAQEWLRLAYSEHDAELDRLLADFNREQMQFGKKGRVPVQPSRTQRQEVQQQQSKTKPGDET